MKKELIKLRKEEKVSIKKQNTNKKDIESNRPGTSGNNVGGMRTRTHHVNQKVRATKLRKM